LRISSFFLIKLKSSVFLSTWAPLTLTSYVSPAPTSCHALTWLAGGIWALYSAFATRVFLVWRGTSIQCQILCVVSSTLLLLHAHPFFLRFFLFLFCLLCGLNAVDEWDGFGVGFPWFSSHGVLGFNLISSQDVQIDCPALVYNFF